MQMTREEILTTFDENWFHNQSLFELTEFSNILENVRILDGSEFLAPKHLKTVRKIIKSIRRKANKNKYASTIDLKFVLNFAELCGDFSNNMTLGFATSLQDGTCLTQQEIDSITKQLDGLFRNVFQVQLYLNAKLYPNVKTYNINDTIEPVVSNSTVSIHV
jgi:hypothetical protein